VQPPESFFRPIVKVLSETEPSEGQSRRVRTKDPRDIPGAAQLFHERPQDVDKLGAAEACLDSHCARCPNADQRKNGVIERRGAKFHLVRTGAAARYSGKTNPINPTALPSERTYRFP